jgi:D-sedoheptulose 7-phosphate isomerase
LNQHSFSENDISSNELCRLAGVQIEESIGVKRELLNDKQNLEIIGLVSQKLIDCYRGGNKVLFMGNGGSAADAQHLAGELVGKFQMDRRALPALALNVNTSVITAIGNDTDFRHIFSRQIEALVNRDDVVVALSTSGNSSNVVEAVEVARKLGAMVISFTGAGGGELASKSDICLKIPSESTPRIQEAHITAGHIICGIVEKVLFA